MPMLHATAAMAWSPIAAPVSSPRTVSATGVKGWGAGQSGQVSLIRDRKGGPTVGRMLEFLAESCHPRDAPGAGGTAMVKAAYSSGTPAIGVGPGNAPAWVCADADVEAAARTVVASKAFKRQFSRGRRGHDGEGRSMITAFRLAGVDGSEGVTRGAVGRQPAAAAVLPAASRPSCPPTSRTITWGRRAGSYRAQVRRVRALIHTLAGRPR
jgi:hypothetical protein